MEYKGEQNTICRAGPRPSHLDTKELPGSFTVTRGQNRCGDQQKTPLLEEIVNGHGSDVPHSKEAGEGVAPRPQVGILAEVVQSVVHTGLKRVILRTVDKTTDNRCANLPTNM